MSLPDLAPIWFTVFCAGAAAIMLAGARLPVLGRSIASKVGIDETAVGLFVLAVVTSLPELAVTLSAMRLEAADLAFGNVLGSNNFNLAAAGALALAFGGEIFTGSDSRRYARTGLLLFVSTCLAGLGVMYGPRMQGALPSLLFSLPIVLLFIAESSMGGGGAEEKPARRADGSRERVSGELAAFAALSLVVVVSGVALSWAAKRIALHTFAVGSGTLVLGETFVGTILVAVATSLPEVTVAWSALRTARSPDIAMGTLVGSNSFNLLVFAVGAPLMAIGRTTGASAWSKLASVNLINVATALVLTAIALLALRWARSPGAGKAAGMLMVPLYLLGLYAVYAA